MPISFAKLSFFLVSFIVILALGSRAFQIKAGLKHSNVKHSNVDKSFMSLDPHENREQDNIGKQILFAIYLIQSILILLLVSVDIFTDFHSSESTKLTAAYMSIFCLIFILFFDYIFVEKIQNEKNTDFLINKATEFVNFIVILCKKTHPFLLFCCFILSVFESYQILAIFLIATFCNYIIYIYGEKAIKEIMEPQKC